MPQDSTPNSFSPLTKLILTILVMGAVVLILFVAGAFGETTISTTITTNPDLERGLVGHWTFDGKDMDLSSSTAEVLDRSGNGNNGNWIDHATTTVIGKIGQALDFDGSDDYVDVGTISTDFTNGLTVAAWVYYDAFNSWSRIIDFGQGEANDNILFGNSATSNALQYSVFTGGGNGGTVSISTLEIGKWQHVIATEDSSGNVVLYKNGVAIKTGSTDVPASVSRTSSFIAQSNWAADGYFDGKMDDVRVYNRALSTDEITRLYDLGATTHVGTTITTNPDLERGLVGHWTFDGPDLLQNAVDRSGQGNTGFLRNFTSTTTTEGAIGQALNFDGSDDLVEIDAFHDVYTTQSICAWFSIEGGISGPLIIFNQGGNNNGFIFAYRTTPDTIVFAIDSDTGSSKEIASVNTFPEDGIWHHICGTYNAGTMTLYIDSAFESTSSDAVVSVSASGNNASIGDATGLSVISGGSWKGKIDDVRVYNRALSAEEITRLYDLGATTHIGTTITTNPDLERGLVGHWTFDGPDLLQNAVDRSGQGNTGFLTGFTSTTTTEGAIGQALDFDGVDDYVDVGDKASLDFGTSIDFTIGAWIKLSATGSIKIIVDKYSSGISPGYMFRVESSNVIGAFIRDGVGSGSDETVSIVGDTTVTDGQWHHATVVYDRDGDVSLYLDGVSDATPVDISTVTDTISNSVNFNIARRPISSFDYFDGTIDDVRIYNRALSAEEITRLYNLGR